MMAGGDALRGRAIPENVLAIDFLSIVLWKVLFHYIIIFFTHVEMQFLGRGRMSWFELRSRWSLCCVD